jgi:hypothetical protein
MTSGMAGPFTMRSTCLQAVNTRPERSRRLLIRLFLLALFSKDEVYDSTVLVYDGSYKN